LGINWVDTAPVYGAGRSEEIVGAALREIPAARRPLVATKCGRISHSDGTIEARLTPDSVRAECEASLRRLGIETIDLYQFHWPEPADEYVGAWETMADLQREGKVRHIGVCNFSVDQLRDLEPLAPVASLQPPYSMIRREAEAELFPYCAAHGLGVVAYSPMGKGLLTGRFSPQRAAALDADDHRSRDPNFAPPRLAIHLELVEGLARVAAAAGREPAHLAIAWVLRRPEVTSAIVGARSPQQIEETAPAGDWTLTAEQTSAIDELLDQHAAQLAALGPA
ncbi:MAG TPA: aldo/keto reductase, partial [Lacipirellulaceae bacterium]|nr:aldo/keto reductase [Lacipirellulaceae bacterium]